MDSEQNPGCDHHHPNWADRLLSAETIARFVANEREATQKTMRAVQLVGRRYLLIRGLENPEDKADILAHGLLAGLLWLHRSGSRGICSLCFLRACQKEINRLTMAIVRHRPLFVEGTVAENDESEEVSLLELCMGTPSFECHLLTKIETLDPIIAIFDEAIRELDRGRNAYHDVLRQIFSSGGADVPKHRQKRSLRALRKAARRICEEKLQTDSDPRVQAVCNLLLEFLAQTEGSGKLGFRILLAVLVEFGFTL